MVRNAATGKLTPFQRDKLYLSLYEACRHRKTAISDATHLTDTVLSRLLCLKEPSGILEREDILQATSTALEHFDQAAHTYYCAFHPPTPSSTGS